MNLAETLRASAGRVPGKPALVVGGDVVHTYAGLDDAVDAVAAGLVGLGIQPGDRVAVLGRSTPIFVRNLYATWRAGAVAVPLNPELTASEVDHVLADSGARALLCRSAPESLDDVAERHAALEVVVTEDGGEGSVAVAAVPSGEVPAQGPTAEDLALLQYTSGTTGRPKGAMLTHGNLLANHAQMGATRLAVGESDAVLGVLPLFHIYGLNVALAYPLAQAATVHLVERFRAVDTLRTVMRQRLSVVPAAPPIYMAWLAASADPETGAEWDLSSVRAAVSGASALPFETWLAVKERFGVEIWQGYGLTETAPVVTSTAMTGDAAPGSVGRPLPGVELRLSDPSGQAVRAGDPGELLVRGPNVFVGYWGDEAGSKAVLDGDGWLHTGDVGYVEDDDVYLVDRTSDLIIVSGFNVYPREVEQALTSHPDVAEAAVVGRPDPRTGERVVAYLVAAPGAEPDVDAIAEHAAGQLARYKRPTTIEVLEALPHLLIGKVSRRALREWDPT